MQQVAAVAPAPIVPGRQNGRPAQAWHSDQDVQQVRQQVYDKIYKLFQQRKPGLQNQWSDKLPDFLCRLEDSLFHDAKTKDEYQNPGTLEARLQEVARRLVRSNQPAAPMACLTQPTPQLNGAIHPQPLQQQAFMQQQPIQTQQQQQPQVIQPGVPGGVPVSNPQLQASAQFTAAPALQPPGQQRMLGTDMRQDLAMQAMKPSAAGTGSTSMQPMVPVDGLNPGLAANKFQQPNGMIPAPNFQANNPGQVMNNGAPIMIRQEPSQWPGGQSPSVLQGGSAAGTLGSGMPGNGMVPTNLGAPQAMANPPGFVPSNLGSMPPHSGMVPVNQQTGQVSPMVPVNQQVMQPMQGNMVPMGGGMIPVSGGMPGMVPAAPGYSMPGSSSSQQQQPGPGAPPGSMGPNGMGYMQPGSDAQLQKTIADRQQYIQKQQRWLLFLRHCAKCQQSEDECQFSRSCRVGKELWQHILTCSNQKCTYPRCVSSKDLLKHHQKCQNVSCPICTPVKEYVRRTRHQSSSSGGSSMGPAMPCSSMPQGGEMGMSQQTQMALAQRQAAMAVVGQKRPIGSVDPTLRMMPMSSGGGHMVPPQPGMMAGPMDMEGTSSKRVKTEVNESILTKNTGTSLLETFDADGIREHVDLIRQAGAALAARTPQQLPPVNLDDCCKVCQQTKLTFEPPCLYCTQCGQRIKRGQTFHATPPEVDNKAAWCHGCFSDHKGDKVPYDGAPEGWVVKAAFIKKRNDDEIEEAWVQCDHCEMWVHQICGLFNKGRNDKDVHYLCPDCLVQGLELGKRQRIESRPQAMLEARDLPHCNLSRMLEERLNNALRQEQAERAMQQGKPMHEVPTATGLTVRVINNVLKKCEVKPKFYEAFRGDGYPEAFAYRQKVVVLFQKMDGVDVALYCMYVQEYGADCAPPNRNCVYLSYIDSVKYFRPEVQAAGNISLRTFVYHQILLGYLQYTKNLGFEQMFIWACPPLQGDDYILYCHPSKQKTPRSDRLRAWYHDMLRKARTEGSVAHVATLWDTYFPGGKDHRMERCSVANIPYLDGDYWPGEAENLLATISDGSRAAASKGAQQARKGPAKGKRYGGGASTDEQLMSKLGEILGGNMKEDFMVVHLREPCTFCRGHVSGGALHRYVPAASGAALLKPPPERKFEGIKLESSGPSMPSGPLQHFQICDTCYGAEMARVSSGQKGRLPGGLSLTDLAVEQLPQLLLEPDRDLNIESEFFETRQAFLSLCQGNHYQFDSMRRAKHSSMMVLYHLHNPSAPAFAATCNSCNMEIEAGTGFRCTVCSDFDMCANCKKAGFTHEHPLQPLTNYARMDETRTRLTEQERLERQQQLQKTLTLLVHACSCNNPACTSSSCRRVRQLFAHAVNCQLKVTGGCQLCKKMWCLLNLHAKSCTASDCAVPRCRELKELRRRQTARLEQARRAAYTQMLRAQSGAHMEH